MFIYTIADADAHLTDATPSPVQKSLLVEDAQILDFITSIESSDNSKDVIEKYNENLSTGSTPSWLEDDFKPASLSDIEVRVFRLKQTDKLESREKMRFFFRGVDWQTQRDKVWCVWWHTKMNTAPTKPLSRSGRVLAWSQWYGAESRVHLKSPV